MYFQMWIYIGFLNGREFFLKIRVVKNKKADKKKKPDQTLVLK
jgi:hypothetical protein